MLGNKKRKCAGARNIRGTGKETERDAKRISTKQRSVERGGSSLDEEKKVKRGWDEGARNWYRCRMSTRRRKTQGV